MKRSIITINEELCIGCNQCVNTCHQGALKLIDGKAKLISESYCDGLGLCLPKCPSNALKVIEKEVDDVEEEKKDKPMPFTCPSTKAKKLESLEQVDEMANNKKKVKSQLMQWPVQIKLLPTKASYLDGASILIAADCTAFASANVHSDYMKGKITMIGCPKLDQGSYSEKLTEILKNNEINSITLLRMNVPCCGGLEHALKQALKNSEKIIPWQVITLDPNGNEIN